jgi:dUTP pyrophosphatase
MSRTFEFARQMKDGKAVEKADSSGYIQAYAEARLPEYATKYSAGADFFCAEEVTIPSHNIKPVLVHTGIKADMNEDEVLEIYNRSSNPKKLGLVLANSVGIIDKDYFSNPDNDGEIMFAFFNVSDTDTVLKVGDKVGQGIFKKFLRPEVGLVVKDTERTGGFGSTDEVKTVKDTVVSEDGTTVEGICPYCGSSITTTDIHSQATCENCGKEVKFI